MIRQQVEKAVQKALGELGLPSDSVSVDYTDTTFGDLSTNVAMVAAKAAGKNPRELAEDIMSAMGTIAGVEKIEIAGPGFINFTLANEQLGNAIKTVDDSYGVNEIRKGEVILFEYTSPNLFKPLHVGNLVGNIIGESLTRLLEWGGADVKRLNYPSDIGLTVAKSVWGLQKTGGNPENITDLGEAYRVGNAAYEDDSAKEEIEAVNRSLYAGDNTELSELREKGIATSKAHLDALCKKLGTKFDAEIPESVASPVGVDVVREHPEVFEESEGAIVYKGEKVGLHTRVFLNSQGLPTYEAKDLGNFVLKQKQYPNWTHSFIVTGSEQKEYFRVLYAAIREVFPETKDKVLGHIPTGFLTLTTGKMSSRKGNVLTGESLFAELQESAAQRAAESRTDDMELLGEQIAVAALKYQIIRQKAGTDIIFDKEKALSLEGDSGPYIQYAYARACSVLAAGRDEGVAAEAAAPETEGERAVAILLMQFPDVVARAQAEYEPHHVAQYAGELAARYNSWYANERVLGTDAAPRRLALTQAVATTLKSALWLLGISAPEKM